MSCTVSPITSTSASELQAVRESLQEIQSGVLSSARARGSASANMTYVSGSTHTASVQRATKLTLPLALTEPAAKLDVNGNKLLYTLKDGQTFKFAPHLTIEYVSVTSDAQQYALYSTEQDESGKRVRYVAVIQAKGCTFTTPPLLDPARPATIPLCSPDAEYNKTIPVSGLPTVAGVGSEASTIVISIFRTTDASFAPHQVTRYGWEIPTGTDQDKLLLAALPSPSEAMSYPVEEATPYGSFFKTCRPPGYKASWARVATKSYSIAIMEQEIPNAVDICGEVNGIDTQPNFDQLKSAIVNGSMITLRYESGGLLYLPVNLFETRPKVGSGVARINNVDSGPFPRKTPRGKNITSGYRPDGKYYSAGGNYQYIQSTWEALAKRYSAMFGVTTGIMWLWEAPPQAQAWYQAAYITEYFHRYTRTVRDIFPPFYYAIMVHANNIGTSMSQKFLVAAAAAIRAERSAPGYDVVAAHKTCKRIYEEKAWLIPKHGDYMNRISAVLQRELPRIDPAMYPNNPSLYPRPV
jgi:hypothetical protein